MNSLRSLLALTFAALFSSSVALADQTSGEKPADSKPAKADCGCATGKDKKVCGIDKDCCCSGEKAKGRSEEKKTDEKKPAKCDTKAGGCDACGA